MRTRIANQSSVAFVGASWVVLLLFGVFAAVSVRKRVRDHVDGIPMTAIRDGLGWFLWAGLVFGRRRAVAADHRSVQRDAAPERKRLGNAGTSAEPHCPSSPKLRGRRRRRTVMPAAGFVC